MSVSPAGECLSDETVFDLIDGKLEAEAQARAERHLQNCASCTEALAQLTRFRFGESAPPPAGDPTAASVDSGEPDDAPPEPLPQGTVVLRYTVGKVIGLGGGGVVQEAYDPRLRRTVALKLLRPVRSHGVSREQAQRRLLREAETMARISHPNVVFILDAFVFDDRVFIVMELVEGQTLATWTPQPGRTWVEILNAFIAAGRGLEAVHAAGMVHGDFKPQNVLVGADGRMRVTDFGLARPTDALAAEAPPTTASADGTSAGDVYTVAGGTRAYMAPELLAGQPPDARSDQFSFCVALWSALYGRHPFEGDVAPAHAAAARGPQTPTEVPPAVQAALAAGLRHDSDERYPSMTPLLQALEHALRARDLAARRNALVRWAAVGLLGLALVGAGAWRARAWLGIGPRCGDGARDPGEECDDGNARNDDACLSTCRLATCGDGQVRARVEECDGGPGCGPSCLTCRRGDASFVWAGNGHCYSRHDRAVDWETARGHCSQAGTSLIRFSNLAEDKAVAEALLADRTAGYWLGLRKRQVDPEFVWLSGEPWPDNMRYWWEREPKPDAGCAFAVWSPHHARAGFPKATLWHTTADCAEGRGFLCEQEPWQVFPQNGHAYRIHEHPMTDGLARQTCVAAGGHLATLTTKEEHEFVARLAPVAVWLDATSPTRDGRFVWTTGEPFDFRAFAPGEPDQSHAHCVVLDKDDLWHDRHCPDEPFAALCEID